MSVSAECPQPSPTVEEAHRGNPGWTSGYSPHPARAVLVHTAGCFSARKTREESTRRRTRCFKAPDPTVRKRKQVTADLRQSRDRSEDRRYRAGSLGGRAGRASRASGVEHLLQKFGSEGKAKPEELARASGFSKTPSPTWSRNRLKTAVSSGLE